MAQSDRSYVHRGILAAGTRSGSRVVMNGTSVAAPQIAREIAEMRATGDLSSSSGRKIVRGIAKDLRPPKPAQAMQKQGNESGASAQTSQERVGAGLVVTPENERQDRLDGLDEKALSSPEQALA